MEKIAERLDIESYELSALQKHIWDKSLGSCHTYSFAVVRVDKSIDFETYKHALTEIIERQEVTRMGFFKPDASVYPLQYVKGDCEFASEHHKVSISEGDRKDFETQLFADLVSKRTNNLQDSRLQFSLYQDGLKGGYIVLMLPSLCTDERGVQLLAEQLCQMVCGLGNSYHTDLQFLDICDEVDSVLSTQRSETYTLSCCASEKGVESKLYLMKDTNESTSADYHNLDVTTLPYDAIAFFEKENAWNIRSAIFSVWQVLLNTYAGSSVSVGVTFDGRQDEEIKTIQGCLSRSIPVKIPVDGNQSLQSLLASADQELNEHDLYQEYYSRKIAEQHRCSRLSRYGFSFYDVDSQRPFRHILSHASIEAYSIHLRAIRDSDGLHLNLVYDSNILSPVSASLIASNLTEAISTTFSQNRGIGDLRVLELLRPSELDFNIQNSSYSNSVDLLGASNVYEQFILSNDNSSDKLVLATTEGEFSFESIVSEVNSLAAHMQARGVKKQACVGVCLDRGKNLIVSILATLKLGAIYLPLDRSIQPGRLEYILQDTNCSLVVCEAGDSDKLSKYTKTVSFEQEFEQASVLGDIAIEPEDVAYVIYTSGSTGKPKGVAISHHAILSYTKGLFDRIQLSENASMLSLAGLATDLGHTCLFGALLTGRLLNMLPMSFATDANLLSDYLIKHPVSCLKIVPSHLSALLHSSESAGILPTECLILGGEATPPVLLKRIRDLAPDLVIINHYGPTETTVGVLTHRVDDQHQGPIPMGKPLRGVSAQVLNHHGERVNVGVVGELFISGPTLARGYLNNPGLTAKVFLADTVSGRNGERMYRTGDLAYMDEYGDLFYQGRKDHQVKIRGFRVELSEIETLLMTHEHVTGAVVLLQKSGDSMVAEEELLVAHVTMSDGIAREEELKNFIAQVLPEYMVPVIISMVKQFPLMPNGKVDRKQLPVLVRGASEEYIEPASELERELEALWCKLLGLDRVSVKDSFFNLGGHSLLVMQVLSWAKKHHKVNLSVQSFFDSPTIRDFGRQITQEGSLVTLGAVSVDTARSKRVALDREIPLSFGQERLWFSEHMSKSGIYNTPHIWCLDGVLDTAALAQAFNRIVERHDVLRSNYQMRDGKLIQVINEYEYFDIPIKSYCKRYKGFEQALSKESSLRKELDSSIAAKYELDDGRLWSVELYKISETRHVLLLNMHHIISDGWSLGVIQKELSEGYQTYLNMGEIPREDLQYQYMDFAVWQREQHDTDEWETSIDYWRNNLESLPALEIPKTKNKQSVGSGTYRYQYSEIDTNKLKLFSSENTATAFMANLSILNLALGHFCDQSDFAVGTSIAGRNRQEFVDLIGFFINQLPIRTKIDHGQTYLEYLEHVKNKTLSAFENQDVPFSLLVSELDPERIESRTPFFDVLFVFQDFPEMPLTLTNLNSESWQEEEHEAKFGLTVYMGYENESLYSHWVYDKSFVSDESVKRINTLFERVLKQILETPDIPISQLEFTTKEEIEKDKKSRQSSKMSMLKNIKRR